MVQRSEVVKAAEAKARRVLDEARSEAGRRRNEADDYCDKRLAQLETVLERAMTVVASGRARLRGDGTGAADAGGARAATAEVGAAGSGAAEGGEGTVSAGATGDAAHNAFFDQDRV
jgi:cell division septum initiation protein DivIVA